MKVIISQLTKKGLSSKLKNCKAFSLVEVILASALFLIFVSVVAGSMVYARERTVETANRMRAILIAEENLEAFRNIKINDFPSITNGTYGLVVSSSVWALSGTSSTVDNFFTRRIIVSSTDTNLYRKDVTSTVSWPGPGNTTNTYSIAAKMTYWHRFAAPVLLKDYVKVTTSSAALALGGTRLTGITLENISPSTDVTIKEVYMEWTNAPGGTRAKQIFIDGGSVWSGNTNSGSIINITDFTLLAGPTIHTVDIDFTKSLIGAKITVWFVLTDDSRATTSKLEF